MIREEQLAYSRCQESERVSGVTSSLVLATRWFAGLFAASMLVLSAQAQDAFVDAAAINLAQTHVLNADGEFGPSGRAQPRLVGDRDTLFKANFIANVDDVDVSRLSAWLTLYSAEGASETLTLRGPTAFSTFPTSFDDEPATVVHRFEDSHTVIIPAQWLKPGLRWILNWVVLDADGAVSSTQMKSSAPLNVAPPHKMILSMIDVQWFEPQVPLSDFPTGFIDEMEQKLPVSELEVRRARHNGVFTHVALPHRPDNPDTAANEYVPPQIVNQDSYAWDTDVKRSRAWASALQRAAGKNYYEVAVFCVINHGTVVGGGVGAGSTCSSQDRPGVFWHELGHSFGLPHWGGTSTYPYKDPDDYGFDYQNNEVSGPLTYFDYFGISTGTRYRNTHVGPYWAFDMRSAASASSRSFIPPWTGENDDGAPERWKASPMQGGGLVDSGPDYTFAHLSDFSIGRVNQFLDDKAMWFDADNEWITDSDWNTHGAGWYYTNSTGYRPFDGDGSGRPVGEDLDVYSLLIAGSMASDGGASPFVHIYPPIGPYKSNVRTLYDPRSESADLGQADVCPPGGCDLSLRVIQGDQTYIYALELDWDTSRSYSHNSSFFEIAINLPQSQGPIIAADILHTHDLASNGFDHSGERLATYLASDDQDGDGILDVEEFPGCESDPYPNCASIRYIVTEIYSQITLVPYIGSELEITNGYDFLRLEQGSCYDLVADVAQDTYNSAYDFYHLCEDDLSDGVADFIDLICPDGVEACVFGKNYDQLVRFDELGVDIDAGVLDWRVILGIGADITPKPMDCVNNDDPEQNTIPCFLDDGSADPESLTISVSDSPWDLEGIVAYRFGLWESRNINVSIPMDLKNWVLLHPFANTEERLLPYGQTAGVLMDSSNCINVFDVAPASWFDADSDPCLNWFYFEDDPSGQIHGYVDNSFNPYAWVIKREGRYLGLNNCFAAVPPHQLSDYLVAQDSGSPDSWDFEPAYECAIDLDYFNFLQMWIDGDDIYSASDRQMYTDIFTDALTLGIGAGSERIATMAARNGSQTFSNIANALDGVDMAIEAAMLIAEAYAAAQDYETCREISDQEQKITCQASALGSVAMSLVLSGGSVDLSRKRDVVSELIQPDGTDALSANDVEGVFANVQRRFEGTQGPDNGIDNTNVSARFEAFALSIDTTGTTFLERVAAGEEISPADISQVRSDLEDSVDSFLMDFNNVWHDEYFHIRDWADDFKAAIGTSSDQLFFARGFWTTLAMRMRDAESDGFSLNSLDIVTNKMNEWSLFMDGIDFESLPREALSDSLLNKRLYFIFENSLLSLAQKQVEAKRLIDSYKRSNSTVNGCL